MASETVIEQAAFQGAAANASIEASQVKEVDHHPFWYEPTLRARDALSDLLTCARNLDLPEDDTSNMACRLVGIASNIVDSEFFSNMNLRSDAQQNEIESTAFDIEALLISAMNFPGQPFGIERRTLLGKALQIIDVLTDLHMNGSDGPAFVPALLTAIAGMLPGDTAARIAVDVTRSSINAEGVGHG